MLPQWLREAGYYCSNNAKEDCNLASTGQVWDNSSKNGHWRRRAAGQPFFAVFSSEKSHESKIRMDERYDLVRSVTDGRHVYIRNYMPHLIYGQHLDTMWLTPTTRVWEQMHQDGKLTPPQDLFWNRKPPEELYDLQSDPDEVKNLAASPAHAEIKARLRKAQREHADWRKHNVFSALAALNSLDALGTKAAPLATRISSWPTNGPSPNARFNPYVPRLLKSLENGVGSRQAAR